MTNLGSTSCADDIDQPILRLECKLGPCKLPGEGGPKGKIKGGEGPGSQLVNHKSEYIRKKSMKCPNSQINIGGAGGKRSLVSFQYSFGAETIKT